YSLGTFSSVSVETQSSAAGPVLVISVEQNPLIGEVEFEGVETLDRGGLLERLAGTHLLEAGRVYNTIRASEAQATIRQAYRQAGFPFDVSVDLEVMQAPDLAATADAIPVRLTYIVDESAEVDEAVFEGTSVFDDDTMKTMFLGVTGAEEFDPRLYSEAVQATSRRYALAGYRGS